MKTIAAIKYAKKAEILNKILLNYRQEKVALKQKDMRMFRQILFDRDQLITELTTIELNHPCSIFTQLQQKEIEKIIYRIQLERDNGLN